MGIYYITPWEEHHQNRSDPSSKRYLPYTKKSKELVQSFKRKCVPTELLRTPKIIGRILANSIVFTTWVVNPNNTA